ncbi:hypothetical protein D3C75_1291850 [compost metagenome]
MLDVALHAPVARFEGAEFDAAQPQPRLWLEVVNQVLGHFQGLLTLSSRARWPPSRKVSSPFFTVLLLCLSCSL